MSNWTKSKGLTLPFIAPFLQMKKVAKNGQKVKGLTLTFWPF
jgi:hypothetical protein